MRHGIVVFILILMLGATSCCWDCDCDDEWQHSGIEGTVMYGEGDCMPVIDEDSREYFPYDGTIYFVLRSALDSLYEADFELLKAISIHKEINDGRLRMLLPPDTYVIMTEEFYQFTPENTVNISYGEWMQEDFNFWKCTSY